MAAAPIVFAHANGFPASCYQYFFAQFDDLSIQGPEIIGMGDYPLRTNWGDWVPELVDYIEANYQEPVVGLGHSMGAVITFMAAQQRPDLFRQVIMLDPPIFKKRMRFMISAMRRVGMGERYVPIARQALKRKDQFPDLEAARTYWQKKKFFQRFHPQCFEDYLRFGVVENEQGVGLKIPKALEAKIFLTPPGLGFSTEIGVPNHYVIARKGVLRPFGWQEQLRLFTNTEFLFWEGGHMFPLEKPEEAAAFVRSLL